MKSTEELKQLRAKSPKELKTELDKQYKKLHEYRFAQEFKKNKNVKLISHTRTGISRIWTVIGEKANERSEK
jgi:ribosomal protein L29